MGRMSRIRSRIPKPSVGGAIACVALGVALGGTAEALNGTNTVSHDDMRNNSVASREIQPNEVRTSDIHDGAVHEEQLAAIVEEDGPNVAIVDGANDGDWSTNGQSVATCPNGTRLIGGTMEWDTDGSVNGDLAIVKMFPNWTTDSWTAVGSNDEGTSETFHAVAFCLR